MTEKVKHTQEIDWRYILRTSALSGFILLFVGLVGMVADFNEREVVRDVFRLGHLLIVILPFIAAYRGVKQLEKDGASPRTALVAGLMIGALTAIPSLLMLFFNSQVENVDDILVHVNRDWIDTITFDNRDEQLIGSMILTGFLTLAGLLGGIFAISSNETMAKITRAVLYGTAFTLLILVFGETARLISKEILPEAAVDYIFRRATIKRDPAIILFVIANIVSFIRVYAGSTVAKNYQSLPADSKNMSRMISWALFVALLLFLPFLIGRTLSDVAVQVGLFILMGFGLNIAIGLAGLLDLGYVTNYAVGAYVMAVLLSTGPLGIDEIILSYPYLMDGQFIFVEFLYIDISFLNFWMILPLALLAAMFAGFFFAMPVLKMRGDYLAIATLGFGEIIGKLAISDWFKPVIGGAQGVLQVPKPEFFGTTLVNPEQLYYIVLAAIAVTLFVSVRINNSRTGRQWMAIREDEDVAAAMGINVAKAKLLAFTISAATGGVAGAIFAAKVGTVFPTSFTVFVSINVLSLIIVGGMGSNPGIVLGAIALIGMPELLREFSEYRFLIYGALLIFMMVNRPEGLWPSQVRQREIHKDADTLQPRAVSAGD